ncbi:MAG: outer membrane protein assembly factor BamC [Acidiferrobacteraceae bacterium]
MIRRPAVLVLFAGILVLPGCAYFGHHSPRYLSATSRPPLEIPPDLTAPPNLESLPSPPGPGKTPAVPLVAAVGQAAHPLAPPCASSAVLTRFPNVSLVRAGGQRWLRVSAASGAVWKAVQAFFVTQGFTIEKPQPAAGIFVTNWRPDLAQKQENLAKNGLDQLLSRQYAAGHQQRYRVRLERGRAGATEVYLQSQGVREVIYGSSRKTDNAGRHWELEPPEPAQDAAMLGRLAAYLGARGLASASMPAANTVLPGQDPLGRPMLRLTQTRHVWSRVGVALGQAGAVVLDADRKRGRYLVRFAPYSAIKSHDVQALEARRLKTERRYEVSVTAGSGNRSVIVTVANGSGMAGKGAVALRDALQQRLR